jgi:hypothetical protein
MPDTNTTATGGDIQRQEQPIVDVQVTPPAAQPTHEDDDFDKDRALATIRKQREFEKEARAKLKRLEELEQKEKERQEAELSELDKLKKQMDALKAERDTAITRHKQAVIDNAVILAAKDANLYNPHDAHKLADLSEVTLGEDGAVQGAEQAIKKLIEERPYLVKQAQQNGAAAPLSATPRPGEPKRNSQESIYQKLKETGLYNS